MLLFATPTSLNAWSPAAAGELSDVNAAIRSASIIVGDAISTAFYAIDSAGMPTDMALLQALSDATCAQVTYWAFSGVDPAGGALGGVTSTGTTRSKKLGTGAVEYDTSLSQSQAVYQDRKDAATELCQEAELILRDAGLASTKVWSYG